MADEKKYSLNSVWFHGVKNEDRQRRADTVLAGHTVLDMLEVIVASKLKELEETSLKDYETPNWAFKEADRHGQVRSYKAMLQILKRTPI